MTDIKQARDVLDRRRKLAVVAQDGDAYRFEEVGAQGNGILWRDFEFFGDQHELVAENVSEGDAALMRLVLHPDLLDAIEDFLTDASNPDRSTFWGDLAARHANIFAAAILAADGRINA